ncbi:MAG: hypothetical protein WBY53_09130 [Acidobacteriaceae bacterium]
MAFRFALASVLRVRESVEKREERALQAIQLKFARLEQKADATRVAIAGARGRREQSLRQRISGGELHSLLWDEQLAEQALTLTLTDLHAAEQQRDAQRTIYQLAQRDREMLSDMCEKQKKIYERERERDEQKKQDDLFIMRRPRV